MDTLLGYIFIGFCIWCVCKFKLGSNCSHDSITTRKEQAPFAGGGQSAWYVKGTYHTSGTLHALAADAYAEREEMMKKYPNDVFHVEEKRF